MKAYISHRLGVSHLQARFDVGIHAEPLCKCLVYAHASFPSRTSRPSVQRRWCIQIKRMCFCLRGAEFHFSQSPLWLNSSGPWSACPGLFCEENPGSRWAVSTSRAPLPFLMTCRRWFSPCACYLFALNIFPLLLTLDNLFKLYIEDSMPNKKRPSERRINFPCLHQSQFGTLRLSPI